MRQASNSLSPFNYFQNKTTTMQAQAPATLVPMPQVAPPCIKRQRQEAVKLRQELRAQTNRATKTHRSLFPY